MTDEEVELFPYVSHTITTEPFCDHDYDHQRGLKHGVYYLVLPKIDLNRLSKSQNDATTWTIDADALAKSDFGMYNERMATFVDLYLKMRKGLSRRLGSIDQKQMGFLTGRFFEEDYPIIVIGPVNQDNKEAIRYTLEIVPHGWIHGFFWRGHPDDLQTDDEEEVDDASNSTDNEYM